MTDTKPKNYWKSIDNAVAEAQEILRTHNLDRLPGAGTLSKMGYPSLCGAISQYHGGFYEFRKILGQEEQRKRPQGYWKELGTVVDEANRAKDELRVSYPLPRETKSNGLKQETLSHCYQYLTKRQMQLARLKKTFKETYEN